MTTIHDIDDPRLTAYALGELEPAEIPAVEAFLADHAEARRLVDETRALAGTLSAELAGELAGGSASEQAGAGAPGADRAAGTHDAGSTTDAAEHGSGVGLDAGRREALVQAAARGGDGTAALGALRGESATDRGPRAAGTAPSAGGVRPRQPLLGLRPYLSAAAVLLISIVGALAWLGGGGGGGGATGLAPDASVARRAGRVPSSPFDYRADDDLGEETLKALSQLGYVDSSSAGPDPSGAASGGGGGDLAQQAEQLAALGYSGPSGAPRAGTHVGQYVPPADAGASQGSGLVAPPTNLGASAAGGFSSGSATDNVSGSPGLLTGRGRKLAAAAANAARRGGPGVEPAGEAPASAVPGPGSRAAAPAVDADEEANLGGPIASADAAKVGAAADDLGLQLSALGYVSDSADGQALRSLGYLGETRSGESRDALRWRGRHLGGESYAPIHENPFVPLTGDPLSALSTFGVDVDRASYANVRRFLHANQAPPADAVRLEELVNAFAYDDPAPEGEHPFAVSVEAATCPWEPRHRLVKVGLSTAQLERAERPAVQLVFLLDVSGSMKDADKLPLLINSLDLLLDQLDERDRVAIVTYASGSQVVLPSTSCAEKDTIRAALRSLRADGSTHASAGIQLAYEVAAEGFVQGGNNRVLMATDGDFNVGVTGHDGLHELIAAKAASGVFLTVLGFGTGNFKDDTAELLADKGNGQYAYIDSLNEAHRVLVDEMEATLVTVAKDVKVQVEFNPAHVAAYRLLGYENRALAAADFRNDKKDAGEIGAGHSVTALYEIRPTGLPPLEGTAELKYQRPPADAAPPVLGDEASPELLTVNLRYKRPDGDTGIELAVPFTDSGAGFAEADEDFRWAAAVAAFGMILRGSEHAGAASLTWVLQVAELSRSFDPSGDRAEFVRLVRTAQGLLGR